MKRVLKVALLSLLAITFLSAETSFAQAKKKKPGSLRERERKSMHSRDSLFRALNKSDTSINNLTQRISQYTTNFNQINNNLAEGLDTGDVSEQLPGVVKRISRIKTLAGSKGSSTLRYLFVLATSLDRMQDELEDWQGGLDDVNNKLVQNQHDLLAFRTDTMLANAIPSDTALRDAFYDRRADLGALWHKADSANRKALFKVNLLQNKVAAAYTSVLDATDFIDSKIKKFAIRAVGGEFGPIWEKDTRYNHIDSAINGTTRLNQIQMTYFFKNEANVNLIGLAFLLLVTGWILYTKYRTAGQFEQKDIVVDHARFVYRKPILSGLMLATTIAPYFYDHPPIFFVECIFLVNIALVLIFVRSYFPLSMFRFLFRLSLLTVVYCVSNLFAQINDADRYAIFGLSILSIIFAVLYYLMLKKEPQGHLRYTKFALKLFMLFQVASLVLNITGRFSLAKILGITAVFNLWLTMSLYFVIRIIIQILYLQLHSQKAEKSFVNLIDYNVLQKKTRNVLTTFSALLWIFFLLQNLNLDDWAHDVLNDLLNQQRSIGGASFTFGGFVIFFIVIWLSSLLSRLISYIYDISVQHTSDLSALKKKNRASTLLIRIGILTVGFLLAVAASNFPIDKLTIIFSAFGVGIGFGLQNIVNNLVSGMILAFEKPIQIGDIIEVNNRTGTVKEIGIRSSKLATGNGSEVIIPNGDLISQNVVNWTLSNTNRQVEVSVSVAYGTDIEKATKLLKDLLCNRKDIMTTPSPEVFVNNITDKAVEFRVYFWAADIADFMQLRSRVLADIYEILNKEGIKLPAS
ncbi:MAG TPA: mechanosensitive ion channel domain-containing protein [Mucilaginibacter sp.]|nr:mechanosensitive ion channel domain-containing protein [Mucilaginibacter sp.]